MVFSVAVWYQSSGSNCLWAPYLESPCSPILCLQDVESPVSCMFNIALSLCSEWTLQNPLEWFSCKCQVAGSHLLAGVWALSCTGYCQGSPEASFSKTCVGLLCKIQLAFTDELAGSCPGNLFLCDLIVVLLYVLVSSIVVQKERNHLLSPDLTVF